VKQEIDGELRFHIEQRTAENLAAGMTAQEAAREARKQFGNFQNLREECRDIRGASFGEAIAQDILFGLRMLRKDRTFSLIAALTLALGIGANTSMFSLLNLMIFRPGPYPHADRLVRIFRTSPHSQTWPHSAADLIDYCQQNKSFERLAFYDWTGFNIAPPGEPAERVPGILASADIFPVLGVAPLLGRVFTAKDEQPGNRVVVLGYKCWLVHFGGDTNILGRSVRIDGENVDVIGVMPPDFDYPLLWGSVDAWRPLALTPAQRQDRGSHHLHALGRLKGGISISAGQAELKTICARLPNTGQDSIRLAPLLRSGYSELGQRMLFFTFGLAGFVLLIACANLANLQLVRAAGRWREFAIRTALGAGRGRLMRQLLTESLLVSAMGGGLGLLLAILCNGFISRDVPLMGAKVDVPLDGRVMGFAIVCSLLTGIIFGLAPAWLARRAEVNDALKNSPRGATGGGWHNWARQSLIIAQLALALALLAGAGLFIRKVQQLTRTDPGWRIDGLLAGQIALNSGKFEGPAGEKRRALFVQQLEERLGALPGVEGVSLSYSLPVWGFTTSGGFRIIGRSEPKPGETHFLTYKESVTPAYFHTLGIQIQKGRVFTSDDTVGKPAVAVINDSFARRFWPGENPIGQRIDDFDSVREIIGVVNDVRFPASLGVADTPFQLYRPLAQAPGHFLYVLLRASRIDQSMTRDVRQAVSSLDASQAVYQLQAAHDSVEEGLAGVSLIGSLLAAFAVLGLALGALGIYGVIAYAVAQRTGEIGIRMALGAKRGQVLWLVLRQGVVLCLVGTLLGFGGAIIMAHLLAALLPELSVRDPIMFLLVTLLLSGVALFACYVPARRATKIDPMTALRCE
jgi:predicted permease